MQGVIDLQPKPWDADRAWVLRRFSRHCRLRQQVRERLYGATTGITPASPEAGDGGISASSLLLLARAVERHPLAELFADRN